MDNVHSAPPVSRAEWIAQAALWAVSVAAILGYGVFATWPALLNSVPGAAGVYGWMFVAAPRAQIVLATAVLAFFLWRRAGTRWLGAAAVLCLLSLGSELAGTTVGLPFGAYRYTDGLGYKLFGHVPLLIPPSWFFMAVPSYAIAARMMGGSTASARIFAGSFILLSWDLVLDPAMSEVTSYWVWASPGPYYGMPILNLFGWYVTGLALMAALAALRADAWIRPLPLSWLGGFYGANLILPVGMCVVAGHWGAILAVVGAAVLCVAVAAMSQLQLSTARSA